MVPALMLGLLLWAGAAGADELPVMGKPIDEGSSSKLGLVFRGMDGETQTPRDVLLWVDDVVSQRRLYGPVPVTPGPSVSVNLPPQANQVVDSSRELERHEITVQYRFPSNCVPVPTPNANCFVKAKPIPYLVRNNQVVVGASTPGTFGPSPAPTGTPAP